jgi:transcriptional regulator with XRE-family HTH domain
MLDANKIGEILRQHFATVTPEEFEANLRRSCPEIFEEENRLLALEAEKETEIVHQVRKEENLETLSNLLLEQAWRDFSGEKLEKTSHAATVITDHYPRVETEKVQTTNLQEIGSNLRQIRQDSNLSIEDISERTRIQPRLLRALEEGRFDVLPEPVYIQSMVKKYGESLGVNCLELAKSVPASQSQIVPEKVNSKWYRSLIQYFRKSFFG